MAVRHKQKEDMEKELYAILSLRASTLQIRPIGMIGDHVLLDGGASHHVNYSPEIPEGSFERQVELAHGTRTRPDITYAQSRISSMMLKAPKTAVVEAIRVLRVFARGKGLCIIF